MDSALQALPGLSLVFLTYVVATASPGPATLAIAGTAMRSGRRAALIMAMGVICGSQTWAMLAAFGLSALLLKFTGMLTLLKIVGGLYLIWLAMKSLRSALQPVKQPDFTAQLPSMSSRGFFLRGYALHMTNPKAVIAWTAIIALGVQQDTPPWMVFTIVAGCGLLGISIFCGYAIAFSMPRVVSIYSNMRRPIEGVLATLFGFAGVQLMRSDV